MIEEAIGTLKDDVMSIDEQGKTNLINLSVTATNDIIMKKGKTGKTWKANIELYNNRGITYKNVAIDESALPPKATVKNTILSIGLKNVVSNKMI